MRSLILFLLFAASALADVGDFILLEQTTTLGRTADRKWPKAALKLFGSNANSAPVNITPTGGLSFNPDTNELSVSGLTINSVTGLQGQLDGKASLTGSYENPAWITGLAWSKISGKPNTLIGYGITSFETDAFILTNVTNSLSENQRGLGRVGGRDTGQLGGGTLQWYQSGAEKIMAWSGTLQAATLNVTSVSMFVTAPVSPTSAGEPGQMAYDESYLYVCVALNTWKRTALSSW